MKNYLKNKKLLKDNYVYSEEMEHDACGVGVIASTEGKKSRLVVEYGIEALKAVWHRGAVDVLTQSIAVSPPPITTISLPFAFNIPLSKAST